TLDDSSPLTSAKTQAFDHSLPPGNGSTFSKAAHTVERHLPVLFAMTSPQRTKAMLKQVSSRAHTNVLQAPRVTLFNGQTAEVADIVQKPFVIGLHKPDDKSPETQAKVRVIEEGFRLTLRAIQLEDSVWLDCHAKFSSLRDVKSHVLPLRHQGEQVELQIPEVACSQMHVKLAVKEAHSLLLYGLNVGENPDESMIVMITPRVLEESPQAATSTTTSRRRETYKRHALPGGVVNSKADTMDPPSDQEIMRVVESQKTTEELIQGDSKPRSVRIVKEKIADYVDPPREYPLVGSAQLHHAHYKCTVYFDEGNDPTRHATDEDLTQVVYVDATHLIRVRPKAAKLPLWQSTPAKERRQSPPKTTR
ncbi:MAG: hypothetical protein AAF497_28535, partial [Planctomycetota bacterium]